METTNAIDVIVAVIVVRIALVVYSISCDLL